MHKDIEEFKPSKKLFFSVLITFIVVVSMPLGAYDKIKDYLSITTGAVETRILNGSADPSLSSGVAAPIGSEYLRNNGDSFKKVGSADTAWVRQLNTSTPVGLELFEDPSFEKGLPSYCVKGTYGSLSHAPSILKSPSNIKAVRVGVEMNETTTYTCSKAVGSEYTGLPIRHKGWVTLAPIGTFNCSITAQWNGSNVGNAQVITHGNNYYDLEVIPTGAGDTGFQISCVNPTSVFTGYFSLDETSNKAERLSPVLANTQVTQYQEISQTASFGNVDITGSPIRVSDYKGIFSYNSSTGIYNFHQEADVVAGISCQNATAVVTMCGFIHNRGGVDIATYFSPSHNANSGWGNASSVVHVKTGDTLRFRNGVSATTTSQNISVSATATSPTIVMQNETFNSDLHLGAWVVQPNTATCSSAVIEGEANVGKWTTCSQVTANSFVVTGCTSRPTQSDADAKNQGTRIDTRNYATAKPCTTPTDLIINIGKNFKTPEPVTLFSDASKSDVEANKGFIFEGSYSSGLIRRSYNPQTGILWLSGRVASSSVTSGVIEYTDSTQSHGYARINASKNAATTGVNAPAMYVTYFHKDQHEITKVYNNCFIEQSNIYDKGVSNTSNASIPIIEMKDAFYDSQITEYHPTAIGSYALMRLDSATTHLIVGKTGSNWRLALFKVEGFAKKSAIQALGVNTSKCQ